MPRLLKRDHLRTSPRLSALPPSGQPGLVSIHYRTATNRTNLTPHKDVQINIHFKYLQKYTHYELFMLIVANAHLAVIKATKLKLKWTVHRRSTLFLIIALDFSAPVTRVHDQLCQTD